MEAHLRVHTQYITGESLKDFLEHYCDQWYIALETDANRSHYQGYVKFKVNYVSAESLRNQLKKRLSDKGNKVYSISLARESKARHIAYLMKEGYEPFTKCGISVSDMQSARELVSQFKARQNLSPLEKLAYDYSGSPDIGDIVRYILNEFKHQGKMVPDVRMMKRYVENLRIMKWPEIYKDKYVEEVERLFQASW